MSAFRMHRKDLAKPRATCGSTLGFTLVEMLIAVAMLGILLMIAVPNMATITEQLRLEAEAQEFLGNLYRAQTEAIKRNQSVYVALTSSHAYRIEYIGKRKLGAGTTFAIGAPDTVRFASFGPLPTGNATVTLTLGTQSKTVEISAGGMLRIQ